MKSEGIETVAPSMGEEDDLCVYKRGFCQYHKADGERFVEVSKRWRDRGGGEGFGYVTSRLVKYRCKVKKKTNPGTSNSDT